MTHRTMINAALCAALLGATSVAAEEARLELSGGFVSPSWAEVEPRYGGDDIGPAVRISVGLLVPVSKSGWSILAGISRSSNGFEEIEGLVIENDISVTTGYFGMLGPIPSDSSSLSLGGTVGLAAINHDELAEIGDNARTSGSCTLIEVVARYRLEQGRRFTIWIEGAYQFGTARELEYRYGNLVEKTQWDYELSGPRVSLILGVG